MHYVAYWPKDQMCLKQLYTRKREKKNNNKNGCMQGEYILNRVGAIHFTFKWDL